MPQSHSSSASWRSVSSTARWASTATQEVPPEPLTSTWCTPQALISVATPRDRPQPVSLTTIGIGSSATNRRIVSRPFEKSRSPPGWTISMAGLRWMQSASLPVSRHSSVICAVVMVRAWTRPRLPSSSTLGACSRTLKVHVVLGRTNMARCEPRPKPRPRSSAARARSWLIAAASSVPPVMAATTIGARSCLPSRVTVLSTASACISGSALCTSSTCSKRLVFSRKLTLSPAQRAR